MYVCVCLSSKKPISKHKHASRFHALPLSLTELVNVSKCLYMWKCSLFVIMGIKIGNLTIIFDFHHLVSEYFGKAHFQKLF